MLDSNFIFLLNYKSYNKLNMKDANKTINVAYPMSDGWAHVIVFFIVRKEEIMVITISKES